MVLGGLCGEGMCAISVRSAGRSPGRSFGGANIERASAAVGVAAKHVSRKTEVEEVIVTRTGVVDIGGRCRQLRWEL